MRKQLAIGVSLLALTALGGVSENDFDLINQQGADSQYTHLVKTSLNQTFEPMSRASLEIGLPNRFSFQTASVSFITGEQNLDFGNMDFTDPTIEQCQRYGYSLTSCSAGQLQGLKCPYNSAYFDRCCDGRYKYDKSACNYPNTVSGDSCGGKYMCYCDRALYPIESCSSPQVTSGGSCTEEGKTYYEKCTCPSNYNQTCDGLNQEGAGEGCTQNGVTYYTSCQCKSGYNMTCTELGPVTPTDYCQMNGIKYYNNCKTCENKCSLDSCPEGVVCEYEDCSQKYCDIGCEVNYTNWCTAPETNCTTLGYIKTEADCVGSVLRCPYDTSKVICEGDGNETCEARASIISSCPENATCTYYNDCPSKIQDWTCNEGYKLFESKCIKPLPILYSDGTISYEKLNDKKPIGIIFDEQNRLAVALSDVTQNGTSGNAIMYWSSGYCDTPNLAQCKSGTEFICGTDGRENTNYILASTCDGETYAANAVNKYYVSCSQDFCQKGKWFLPSVKELREIGASILSIKYAFEVLDSSSSRLKESSYWSSTAMSDSSAWLFNMYSQEASHTGKQNYSNVRAIVKY